jgi:hypothetical protein
LAVFLPTNTHYVFTVVTDKAERARVGLLSAAYQVHHRGTGDTGGYAGADVLELARTLALAQAQKVLSGT